MRKIVFLLCLLALAASGVEARRKVMPWMCLERCNSTTEEVKGHLEQILSHRDVIDAVSFELFNLGENGTLVRNNLSAVAPALQAAGFETYPMISSYPYPPEFLSWMRSLFNGSEAGDRFIDDCVMTSLREHFTGLNVDWEPTASATVQDAIDYARFLALFTERMHSAGKKLSVDVGGWSVIWDLNLLSDSKIDKILTMSTYTNNIAAFYKNLDKATAAVPLSQLGVGLATLNLSNNTHFTTEEIQERFDALSSQNIEEIDLWVAPIPDEFWPFLYAFVNETKV